MVNQNPIYSVNSSEVSKLKIEIKAEKEGTIYEHFAEIRRIIYKKKRLNVINREKGVSNWLLVLPIVENGDSVRLRYG